LNIFLNLGEMLNAQLSMFNFQVIGGSSQQCCQRLFEIRLPEMVSSRAMKNVPYMYMSIEH